MNNIKNNRWFILTGAIIAQICIGTIYSWSLFNAPLMKQFNWTENQVVMTFSIATFMFAFSTIFSGFLLNRIGPKHVTIIGGILYGGGLILASQASTLIELYLYYGVISGCGVGFVYVCPLSTSVKWFPNKKGFITGIVVGAFGLGSLVFKFIIEAFLDHFTLAQTLRNLGIVYMILIILGAHALRNPRDYQFTHDDKLTQSLSTREMIKKPLFYNLWILFFLGCLTGLLVIGMATDLGITLVNLSYHQAAQTIVFIGIFNAFGRITWGILSDKYGRLQIVSFLFTLTSITTLILGTFSLNFLLFFMMLSIIAFCFGGFLSVFPTITEESFGKTYFGSNYGIMYQAYGIAALTGPLIFGLIHDIRLIFILFSLLMLLGIASSIILSYKEKGYFFSFNLDFKQD